jgi:kynurenine aminotransferase
MVQGDPFKPAARVSGQRQDVWSIVNEAAAKSEMPVVNLGQGFFGYNPPQFCIDAAKEALDKVECNQYSPTKVRPRALLRACRAYERIGTTAPEEGHRRCLLSLLRQDPRP